MTREALGEFEHMVLLAILHTSAIASMVCRSWTKSNGEPEGRWHQQRCTFTLRRLEQKGLQTSWMSDSTPERGGKSRRCVKITGAGLDSLRESRKVLDSMWKGLDPELRGAQ